MPKALYPKEQEQWLRENHFTSFEDARRAGSAKAYCRNILQLMDQAHTKPTMPDSIMEKAVATGKPETAEGVWFQSCVDVSEVLLAYAQVFDIKQSLYNHLAHKCRVGGL